MPRRGGVFRLAGAQEGWRLQISGCPGGVKMRGVASSFSAYAASGFLSPRKGLQLGVCVCLLLQDLLQSCSRGGEEESGRHVL